MKIQNVKGCLDFLPEEQKVRNYINEVLITTFKEYGYVGIETPILNYYDMLSDKYDENNDILKEIYKLKDQGDRSLGLRYDLTVPFAKFIALNKNKIKLPFKRYEIAKVFRDGPVKLGRDREFTQCDVDVVGIKGQKIEAELMSLYVRAFNKLKLDILIKYNSRNLMRGMVMEVIEDENLISKVITVIDKIDKITKEEFINYLLELGVSLDGANKLLDYFKLDLVKLNELFKNSSNLMIKEGLEETNNLTKMIKKIGIEKYCIFTPSLARGQEYYTGNVFEVIDATYKLTSSIGGGGRYDNMITNFINDGEVYPAVGISFGLSSLYELLKDKEEFKNESLIDIYIIPMNTFEESFKISEKLRDLGFKVEIEMEDKKLKKSLDFVNKNNISYAIIIGEDEIKNNTILLKDMKNRESFEIEIDKLEKIKDIIQK